MGDFLRLGLRVYVDTVGSDTFTKHGVFYSRCAGGPYYRWYYEAEGDRLVRLARSKARHNILLRQLKRRLAHPTF